MKKYRVWVEQVNQTWLDVEAKDKHEAREKGYKKWRKEYAHSYVSYIEVVCKCDPHDIIYKGHDKDCPHYQE